MYMYMYDDLMMIYFKFGYRNTKIENQEEAREGVGR